MTIQPCLIDLSDRSKFRLIGSDRDRYLNGQVSNQVSKATAEAAIEACVCNLKGKLEGVVFITRSSDDLEFWIDAPAILRESLFARLSRYIIADDCELEDMSEAFGLVHGLGEVPDLPGAAWRTANRFGPPGKDFWFSKSSQEEVLALGTVLTDDQVKDIRVLYGVPAWGAELSPDTLPAEAGLDHRAVDFHKGCYLGQEVISRIESVGRVNRVLVLIETNGGRGIVGAGLFPATPSDGEKPVGTITSVSSDGRHALAFVKRDFAAPETRLVLKANDAKMESHIWEVRTFESGT